MNNNNSLNLPQALSSGGLSVGGYIPNQFTPVNFTPIPTQTTANQNTAQPTLDTQPRETTQPTTPPNQGVANSMFINNLNSKVSSPAPIPSTVLATTSTPTSVVSTADKFYQDYLKTQEDIKNKLLSVATPTQAELDLKAKLNNLKLQAMRNQETALNSGETSSFAGGEAQRVARNDAFSQIAVQNELELLQSERENALKGIEILSKENDKSIDAQLKYNQLKNTVGAVDKQAQETLFNLQQQNPNIPFIYDRNKTGLDNFTEFQKLLSEKQKTQKAYIQDPLVSSLYNLGIITGGSEAERQMRANNIATLPPEQKALTVQALAFNTLGPTQKTNFEANQRASQLAQNAISLVTEDMINNPYKYTFNNNIGYVLGKKDLQYTNFIQNIQSVVAPIRLSYFGASLTNNEEASANQFLPDPKKDDTRALVLKLNNVDAIASFTNDVMISNALGTPRPVLDAYIKIEADGTPRPEWVREAYKNNYSKTEIDNFKKQVENQQAFNSVGNTSASIEIPKTSRLAFINNNPGNLRFVGQSGAVEGEGGFAKFNTPEDGLNALTNQIKLDTARGLTLSQFISKYAPPTENNTKQYLTQASSSLGVTPDTPLTNIPLDELTKFIALKESSTRIS